LIRKQTYITTEQDASLKRAAPEQNSTQAAVLRHALDAWLATESRGADEDPLRRLIGFVELPDSHVDHDDMYDVVSSQDHDRR
jgi:hypothetical protein